MKKNNIFHHHHHRRRRGSCVVVDVVMSRKKLVCVAYPTFATLPLYFAGVDALVHDD
jgi:hypothetical protein